MNKVAWVEIGTIFSVKGSKWVRNNIRLTQVMLLKVSL